MNYFRIMIVGLIVTACWSVTMAEGPVATTAPASTRVKVVLVTNGNPYLKAAVEAMGDRYQLVTLSPAEYEKSDGGGAVYIFDGYQPENAPQQRSALYFAAVPVDSKLAETDGDGKTVVLKDLKSTEPLPDGLLTKGIKIKQLFVSEGIKLREAEKWMTVMNSDQGPLIESHDADWRREIVVGFDIQNSNWPMQVSFPLFINRSVEWLAGATAQMVSQVNQQIDRIAKNVGRLGDDEQSKWDALRKKMDEEIISDPKLVDAPDFQVKSLQRLREVLTPEHKQAFDKTIAESKKRMARIHTSVRLRNIGLALNLYSQQHDGRNPPEFGALNATSPDDFLVWDSKTQPPADWATMTAKAQAGWVNKNSDFVYLADGKSVVAYVKPEVADDGNEFLLADGSVLSEKAEDAKAIIAELKDGKNPPPTLKWQNN